MPVITRSEHSRPESYGFVGTGEITAAIVAGLNADRANPG